MSIPQLLTEILGGGRIGPPPVVGRPKKVGGNRVKSLALVNTSAVVSKLYQALIDSTIKIHSHFIAFVAIILRYFRDREPEVTRVIFI